MQLLHLGLGRHLGYFPVVCFPGFSLQGLLHQSSVWHSGYMARRGFTIRLKRLKPRVPDFMGPQIFGSKDNFQHFCKQLYLNFCFGSMQVFYYAAIKRSLLQGWPNLFNRRVIGRKPKTKAAKSVCSVKYSSVNNAGFTSKRPATNRAESLATNRNLTNSCKYVDKRNKHWIWGDNSLSIWNIAIHLEESHKTCWRAALCTPLFYSRSGHLIWLGDKFEKAAYSLKQVSVQVSLNTNVYCGELRYILYLKNFLNASSGHWKRCSGHVPRATICPPLVWQLCGVWKLPFCGHRAIKLTQNCVSFTNPCINLLALRLPSHAR